MQNEGEDSEKGIGISVSVLQVPNVDIDFEVVGNKRLRISDAGLTAFFHFSAVECLKLIDIGRENLRIALEQPHQALFGVGGIS